MILFLKEKTGIKGSFVKYDLKLILLSAISLLAFYQADSQTIETFTTSTTWTCPAGVTTVSVECWGGGGAGGSGNRAGLGSGGGGGGAHSSNASIPVTPLTVYTVTVGAGGTIVTNNSGNPGGDTWFINSTTILAKGGSGGVAASGNTPGAGGTGGLASAGIGSLKFSGGTGGSGNNSNTGGGGGSSAGTAANGNNGGSPTTQTGATAPAGGGSGGNGGSSANGSPGIAPGGGGGGEGNRNTGGNGANGKVVLTYTVSNDNCPASTSVTPGSAQNLCQGAASNLLTATITTSGGSGTPTLQYQWYYNTTNSNIVSGATLIGGAVNSTYTPLTGASEVGDRWYFCVGYATDNNCAQTNATQSLASNAVQVSVSGTPTTASAGSPQTICDGSGATLGANAAVVGTGAWSVVSGPSTSTAQFSSTSNPTAIFTPSGGAGSYVLRWTISNNPCPPSTSDVTITVNAPPTTSNAGSPQTICDGSGATLGANTPVVGAGTWSVVSGPSTSAAQFNSLSNPLAVFTPAGGTGSYVLRWTISNAPCTPSTSDVTITVKTVPALPVISGPTTVTASTGGYIYSIPVVTDATNYTWTVPGPPGAWTLNSGQSTNAITTTSGTQGGNITVFVTNSCGPGPTASLAVSIGVSSNCPASTTTAPGAIQNLCVADPAGQLTATITTSGGSGTPTLQYQWYYNTSNSNTVSGATLIGGATSQNYTPLTTVAEIGDRWYFCVGYASDNGCGQTNATQTLASNAVQVTVNDVPAIPGAISGPTPVSPSTGSLVYSIAAVPTATSYTWSVPAGWAINAGQGTLSMTATSGSVGQNGNISVTASNTCGTSTAQTLAVTVVAAAQPPTITLGSNPTVCQGSTSANLPYSATTNSPNQYSIDYNSTANTAGFIDVVNAALSASPIILTVPGGAATGTYFGNLSVKNSTSGLSSGNYSITVQIIATPATPGVIIGSNAVPELTTGITYAIMPVAFATTYTWTVPSGWAITSGQGSNGITVTSGLAGQNGNITVTAGNSCGTSAASTLAVTSQVPTDHSLFGCSACHITHTSPGGAITSTLGNANLCLSCHVTTGVASGKPFTNADKAIPGTSGNSHAWDVAALNSTYETDVPTETQMALRVYSGEIVCSTCHDQHNSNANVSYTRISNTGDAMCKDCHSPRNVGRYLDNPGVNKGSHPVGLAYSGTGDFEATPTGAVTLPGGNVECSSCHQTHYAPTSDGTLLRQANDDALCTSCHTIFASGGTPVGTHNGMNCSRCHQTHNTNKANIYMIRNTIATPNSGNKTVNFTALTGTNSFADGDATYDGVCEVCHTTTNHYRNDGLAPDQSHTSQGGQNGANCMGCHPHNSNFSPAGGCHDCHDSSKPHLYPTNAQGYNEGSHAVHASKYVCSTCHFGHGSGGVSEGSHPSSTINIVFNPAGLAALNGATPSWNSVNKTCSNVYCHSNAAATPTYTTTPNWNDSNSITTCQPCHVVDVASSVSPGTAGHVKHVGAQYSFACSTCHNGLNNNSPNHADGTKDVVFDPNGLATRNGADGNSPAWNSGNRNCSQVYCHSTGTTSNRFSEGYAVWNNSASTTAITYATTPNWSTGSITACGSCHAGPVTMPSGPSYTVQEGNNTGLVTASSQYPNTGAHGSNTGAHSSPDQLIILTENATYGNALSHSWPFVQCFWCHNNDAGAASGVPKKQGTYGTSKHVDGLTWYFPSWYGYGGGCEKTSGGQAPPYYTMDTQTECNSLGSGYIWRPEPVDPEKKGSMVPGLGYSWFGPTNEHCGNGKNCW